MAFTLSPQEIESYYRHRIPELRQSGSEWRCPCPLHGGKRDSFSINAETGVWNCHSECDAGGDIIAFEMKSQGVDFKQAVDSVSEIVGRELGSKPTKTRRKQTAVYRYVDSKGSPLFEVVRYEPKAFRQRRLTPDGHVWNLKGVERVPYRLRELIAADTVYLAEGEKDADRLAGLGLAATTTPGGASQWRGEYARHFADKHVVILADNDAPGRKYAAKAVKSLLLVAASVKVIRLPGLPEKGDVSDWLDAGGTKESLLALVEAVAPLSLDAEGEEGTGQSDASASGSQLGLTKVQTVAVQARDVRFVYDGSTHYVRFLIRGHFEVWPIDSERFRAWLVYRYYERESSPLPSTALSNAIEFIKAKAQMERGQEPAFVRVGKYEGKIYLDLCDEEWRAIEISAEGWKVVENPPINFVRRGGMLPLPEPVRGGSLDKLRNLINAPDKTTWVLCAAWLIGTLHPDGPFPILNIQGEQGSAKSTTARFLRQSIDPNVCPIRSLPRNEQDLAIAAQNSWILAYDNLSGISGSMSDAFCRLSTGAGFATRALYTNTEEVLITVKRAQIVNGIDQIASRDDFAERSLVVELPAIPEERRREESDVLEEFERSHPEILGALLDVAAAALKELPDLKLDGLPRMADFVKWVCAAEVALGWEEGAFLSIYEQNRESVVAASIERKPAATACVRLVNQEIDEESSWQGSASELLTSLRRMCPLEETSSRYWPKNPQSLSRSLRRSAPFLRERGVLIEFGKDGERWIRLSKNDASSNASRLRPSDDEAEVLENQSLIQAPDAMDAMDDPFSSLDLKEREENGEGEKEEQGKKEEGLQDIVHCVQRVQHAEESKTYDVTQSRRETDPAPQDRPSEPADYEEFIV